MIQFVIVESPYSGPTPMEIGKNLQYARKACLDCIQRNETPFASHLFYPQFLDDSIPAERACGINRGLEIGTAFWKTSISAEFSFCVAFYVDNGWSKGMEAAVEFYTDLGARIEIRRLEAPPSSNRSSQIDTPDD